MSLGAFDYPLLGGTKPLDKSRAARSNVLFPVNHAMTIVGYDPGKSRRTTKYEVLNSWSQEFGDDGVIHYYGDALAQQMSMAVVPRRLIPKRLLRQIESIPPVRREFRLKPDAAMQPAPE